MNTRRIVYAAGLMAIPADRTSSRLAEVYAATPPDWFVGPLGG